MDIPIVLDVVDLEDLPEQIYRAKTSRIVLTLRMIRSIEPKGIEEARQRAQRNALYEDCVAIKVPYSYKGRNGCLIRTGYELNEMRFIASINGHGRGRVIRDDTARAIAMQTWESYQQQYPDSLVMNFDKLWAESLVSKVKTVVVTERTRLGVFLTETELYDALGVRDIPACGTSWRTQLRNQLQGMHLPPIEAELAALQREAAFYPGFSFAWERRDVDQDYRLQTSWNQHSCTSFFSATPTHWRLRSLNGGPDALQARDVAATQFLTESLFLPFLRMQK